MPEKTVEQVEKDFIDAAAALFARYAKEQADATAKRAPHELKTSEEHYAEIVESVEQKAQMFMTTVMAMMEEMVRGDHEELWEQFFGRKEDA